MIGIIFRCQEKFKKSTDEDENEIDEKLTQILARIKAKEELSRKCWRGLYFYES